MQTHRCENCPWRQKAQARPDALLSKLWHWHTSFCPGWKAYQKSLTNKQEAGIMHIDTLEKKFALASGLVMGVLPQVM